MQLDLRHIEFYIWRLLGAAQVEEWIYKPLLPYVVTRLINELCAEVFACTNWFETIGLYYFNVFGKRQDPDGAYANEIPKRTAEMIAGRAMAISGRGETTPWYVTATRTRHAAPKTSPLTAYLAQGCPRWRFDSKQLMLDHD